MRVLTKRETKRDDHRSAYLFTPGDKKQAFCGHSIDVQQPPRANCNQCWTFFFISNKEFTQSVGNDLTTGKREVLVNQFGSKLVKKAEWFFAAIAKAKEVSDLVSQEMEAEELQNKKQPVNYDVVFKSTGEQGSIQGEVVA